MRDILTYICMFLALISVASCSEKELVDTSADNESAVVETGNLVDVPCELIVQPFGGNTTKAAALPEDYTSEEQDLDNFWLLQFDADGKFLAAVYHIPIADAEGNKWGNSYVRMSETYLAVTKTVWIVANIGETDTNGTRFFSNYAGKTLTDFYNDGLPLSDLNQLRAINGGSSCVSDPAAGLSIPLSGSAPFDVNDLSGVDDKKGLVVRLKSIVAKLTVDASAVANVTAARLMRIPSRISYAPDKVTQTTFRSLTYDYEITVPTSKKFTIYIPQNKPVARTASANQATSGNERTKTENAPVKATYISMDVTSSDKTLAVNIFIGEDEKKYQVLANTHYKETIAAGVAYYNSYLNDSKDDSRLIQKLVHTEKSNCYMLHPVYQGTGSNVRSSDYKEEVYVLPFVDRVNEAAGIEKSGRSISDSDEWIIHHVWQDEPKRLIYLAESSGLSAWENNTTGAENYAKEYFGRGVRNVYVAAKRSASGNYTRGNVVLALRKKDPNGNYTASNGEKYGNIIWSWHLWVTDYEPDTYQTYSSGYHENVPGVSGSRIFHFIFWSSTYSKCRWIMDRNLGARGWQPATYEKAGGLNAQERINPVAEGYGTFYQWGRKDPFPGEGIATTINVNTLQLYDIEGKNVQTRISSENPTNAVAVSNLHSKPTTLQRNINYGAAGPRWASTTTTKSLYDPCPPGWEVPSNGVYRNFVSVLKNHETTNMNNNYVPRNAGSYYGYGVNDYEAFAVDPSGNQSASYAIYFPAAGFISSSGNRDMGGIGDLWTLEQKSATAASYLYIGCPVKAGDVRGVPIAHIWGSESIYFGKHNAFAMRCVKTYTYKNL